MQVCDTEELRKIANDATSREKASITAKYLYDPAKSSYISIDHQINCTYYSACEEDDHNYLLARAIQFFCPGIPLVYYVGMLAGSNDLCLVKKEGSGRAINRHSYSYKQAVKEVERPVVQALLELCRFRNQHPAFDGEMAVDDDVPDHVLGVTWQKDDELCRLTVNFETKAFEIKHTAKGHKKGDGLRCVKFNRVEAGQLGDGVEGLSMTAKKGHVEIVAPAS
jgi:sucrose phosphorylase